jgi:two-component system sensor histidine kinase/response regulator
MHDHEKVQVLIAEDDYLVGEMIRGLLQDAGYNVVGEAMDGLEAVEKTQSLRPDVVLMDIEMPEMDGIEAMRRIYAQCPTPVVVLTAYDTPELVQQASESGVGAYLVKPPNAQEIDRAITIAMARFEDKIHLLNLTTTLQERNTALDAFAHTVAHDLKTPLTLLLGYAELLETNYTTVLDPEGLLHLRKVSQMGHKISNITDELLLLAELRTQVPVEMLGMRRIIANARGRLSYMIQERQAEIIIADHWPVAVGYSPWIEEVWTNYLSNGLKYGGRPEEGLAPRLELGATAQTDRTIRFWVADNGPGIAAPDQARLFTPFTQLDQTRARGHGLGLSIVKHIVERLEGSVGLESEVGMGSTFWFTLPAA